MTLGGLFTVETAAQAPFWIVVGLTLAGAVIAVFPRNILYNVLGLVLALTGVAGLYMFLNSMFVAMMQLLIYVGAICIAIVFAIMLSRPLHMEAPKRNMAKLAAAAGAAFLFFAANLAVVFKTSWQAAAEKSPDWTIATIGHMLLTRYELVFEVISLVLLVAIIGAILTAGYSRRLTS
jgi:NADH-quinone oxidoreductase subunit J